MKNLILFTLLLTFTFAAKAQEAAPTPEATVTILQSTADACKDAFTERKALRNEIEVKDKVIEDLKAEIVKLQIDLARTVGEKTGA